jgi:aryl-phospho-beta-D-glucosidase BglC (GH1 family)
MGVPGGLDHVDVNALAGLIAAQGFNCVRLPFSVWMTRQTTPVADTYLAANPRLHGSTPMQVYDACVKALTDHGLIVIPNCHLLDYGWCCTEKDSNGLWFNDRFEVAMFTAAWQQLTQRYAGNPLVAAMDIKNEPRHATLAAGRLGPAWGGGSQTDLAREYASLGNMIHQINPHPLIICEGMNYATDLSAVAGHGITLAQPSKVVYSLHDYSWSGHSAGETQATYFKQMNDNGGYLLTQNIAPVWIGEFGGNAAALAAPGGGGRWWANLRAWLAESDADWCWWALNPVHGRASTPGTDHLQYHWGDPEPYGLLTPDWKSVRYPALVTMLKALMPAKTGPGIS